MLLGMSQPHSITALVEPLTAEQIEVLPVYEWEVARIGDEAPPLTYQVTEQSIADYCEAVRNDNSLYLDQVAASGGPFHTIVAPPTYAFKCAPLRRNEAMHARGFASPEEKGVRATPYAKSELFFERPIRPGQEITSFVRLEDMYERRGSQFMTWRTRAVDKHGAPVVEYTYTIIWRQGPREEQPPAQPKQSSAGSPPAPQSGEELPPVRKLESQAAIDRYAELTRLRPRIGQSLHSDESFARRTIFGGTVNMGVATAAYCSEALERAFGPAALLRPGARLEFKGIRPVRAGDEITVGGRLTERHPDRALCELVVHNHAGALVGVGGATVLLQ
jgi:acyl dehydratase